MTHPSSFYKSYKSYTSYASVTPAQTAYHRCYQVALHTPTATLRPSQTKLRKSKPTGYTVTHHTPLPSVNHRLPPFCKRHALATRIPPLLSSCLAYPCGKASPEPNQTATGKPSGYIVTHPYPSHNSHNSHNSHASVTPPQTAYPRCYQVALHTPTATLRPSQTRLRQVNPRGIS